MAIRAMVLVLNDAAGISIWQDYFHRCRSVETLKKQLRRGVRQGRWFGWRIMTIQAEGRG